MDTEIWRGQGGAAVVAPQIGPFAAGEEPRQIGFAVGALLGAGEAARAGRWQRNIAGIAMGVGSAAAGAQRWELGAAFQAELVREVWIFDF